MCLAALVLTATAGTATATTSAKLFPLLAKNKKKAASKDSVVVSEYKKLTGKDSADFKNVARVIKKDKSFYLEIPARLMGRTFLVVNRLQQVPSELNEASANRGLSYEEQCITFEWLRKEKKMQIRQQRPTPEVAGTDAMARSVADNYINPIIASLKVEAVAPDSSTVLVKVDDLFNGKQTMINDVFNNINLGNLPMPTSRASWTSRHSRTISPPRRS